MARQTQNPAVKTATIRNEKVTANVPQHQLLKLDLESLILVTACLRGNQKAQKAAQQKLEAEGVIVKTPGNNKTEAYSTVLVNEAILRAPATWEAAKARVEAQRVQVKGTMPAPDQVSQIAAEAAAQQVEPEMVSEPTETQMPEEGKKEFAMSDVKTEEFAPELLLGKNKKPLTGGALQARLVSLRAKKAAQEAVAPETKEEEPIVAPEPEVVVNHPEGSLAAQVAAIAPALGMKVEPPTRLDFLPSILSQLRTAQYKELGVVDPDQVRNTIQHLPAKVTGEAAVLVEVVKNLRAKAGAAAKKAAVDEKQRVEQIQAAARGLYQVSKEQLMKRWAGDGWASPQNPKCQSVALAAAEEFAIETGLTMEEALPALQAAAQEDAGAWIVALEKDRGEHRTTGAVLQSRVNNLTPEMAKKVWEQLGLGMNPKTRRLRDFFLARFRGQTVEVTPAVYREALPLAAQLKQLFQLAYAKMEEAQREAAMEADVVAANAIGEENETREEAVKAAITQAQQETVQKAVQTAVETKGVETVVERPTVAPEPQTVVEEVVEEVVEAPKAEEIVPPAEEVAAATVEEPKAEVKPDAETLKGLRKLNAFFKRQAEKVKAKAEQFGNWVTSKEPKKPTPRALRRETQITLEEVISMQPKEGNAFLDLKEGSELAKAIKDAFETYVSMTDAARIKKGVALGLKTGTKASLAKGEYPQPVLTAEMAWALEIAHRLWVNRTGGVNDSLLPAWRAIKGLPGRESADLAHIVTSIYAQLQEWTWSADQKRVLDAISNAKVVGKEKLKDGSYVAHYSYHAAVLTAKGLFGFVGWAKLPFRAAIQLVGGSAWGAISAKKGERTAAARAAVKGAWEKIQRFGWVLPKSVVTKAWKKVSTKFAKKAKTPKGEQVEALETKGLWERAVEGVRHMFDAVQEATSKVVEAGKTDKAKPIGAAVGAIVAGAAAVLLGGGVLVAAAAVVIGATLGWFAKKALGSAWGWLKGRKERKAAAAAATPVSAETTTASA